MARPIIIYNITSGSDTLASGAGPATALTGTNATVSGQVITLDGSPDTSGVATDGSHAIWFESTDSVSNRRLFRITAKTSNTVTVFGTIIGSGVNWAIGGKRKTLQSGGAAARDDWQDRESGWIYEFEVHEGIYLIDTAIDTGSAGDDTDGPVTFRSSNPGVVVPVIDAGTNAIPNFGYQSAGGGKVVLDGLKIKRGNASSSGRGVVCDQANTLFLFRNCEFDCTGMIDGFRLDADMTAVFDNCDIHSASFNSSSIGIQIRGGNTPGRYLIYECDIHDNNGDGIQCHAGNTSMVVVDRSKIYDNGSEGISFNSILDEVSTSVVVSHCVFDRNASDGIVASSAFGSEVWLTLIRNAFTSNGGYGVHLASNAQDHILVNLSNHYDGNTSGARNNLTAGDGDTSGDPLFESVVDGDEDYTPTSGSPLIDPDGLDTGSIQSPSGGGVALIQGIYGLTVAGQFPEAY